jgi:hypothetical protein
VVSRISFLQLPGLDISLIYDPVFTTIAFLEIILCSCNFVSVVICFPKLCLIIPFMLLYLCNFILIYFSSVDIKFSRS